MLTFYLVRHGTKAAIPFDPPLTPVGIQQAEVTSEYLKNVPFKKVLASPKLRAVQTAEIISRPHSLGVIKDERLIERLEWEKRVTFDDFISEWNKTDLDRSFQPYSGESSITKGKLMKNVIDEFSHDQEETSILMVTHGGAIGDLLRNLFGERRLPHRLDPVTNAPHILINECSLTIISKNKEMYELITLNNTEHLV